MKNKNFIPTKKQPLIWRQAVGQAEHRGYSMRNIIMMPIINYYYQFKNYPSLRFDHLIVGSNPVLSAILLDKLYKHFVKYNLPKQTVGLLLTDEEDYWGYHILSEKLSEKNIWSETLLGATSFENLLEDESFHYFNQHILIILNDHESYPKFHRYDSFVDGHIIHLGKNYKKESSFYQKKMPITLETENLLRKQYKDKLLKKLEALAQKKSLIFKVKMPNPATSIFKKNKQKINHNNQNINDPSGKDPSNNDSRNNDPSGNDPKNNDPTLMQFLLSKNQWLTSMPINWMQMNPHNNAHKDEITKYTGPKKVHLLGTSQSTANGFIAFEKQPHSDILALRELKLIELAINDKRQGVTW